MRAAGVQRVDVAPLREAFERSDVGAYALAKQIGWTKAWVDPRNHTGHVMTIADTSRLQRALGLRSDASVSNRQTASRGRHYRSTRTTIPADTALLIADALGLDPADVGL